MHALLYKHASTSHCACFWFARESRVAAYKHSTGRTLSARFMLPLGSELMTALELSGAGPPIWPDGRSL